MAPPPGRSVGTPSMTTSASSHNDADNGHLAAFADAHVLGADQQVAVAEDATDRNFVDHSGTAGAEHHQLAVDGNDDFLDAVGATELGVLAQVAHFAVHRHEDLRLEIAVELFQLVAARVSRDVDEGVLVGHEIDAHAGQRVVDPADALLVAWDGARRKDRQIALGERDVGMGIFGDAGHGGARFTLTAGDERHHLVAAVIAETLLVDVDEVGRQIAGFDRDLNDAM